MTASPQITAVDVIPVALPMRGTLLHSDGKIPPWQVRHIVKLHTDTGITGLGEASPRANPAVLAELPNWLAGEDPFNVERLRLRMGSGKFYRMDTAAVGAAVETACLDIQGKHSGKPVADILGGRVRDSVGVIAYLFRKHGSNGFPDVLEDGELAEDASRLVDAFGFRTLKYKAGALRPEQDIAAAASLRAKFPQHRLRVDPNGAWSVATAIQLARQLADLELEWIEDPCMGLEAMSEFGRRTTLATATNMCCIQPAELPSAVAARSVNVILHDLWYIGGPASARQMAMTCRTFGLGVGIHAGGGSAETGIGLAAQAHLAASLPGLVNAIDTMHYELIDDITNIDRWKYVAGDLEVPDTPGLGIELDEDKLAQYAEEYRRLMTAGRDSLPVAAASYPSYPQY
jgi:glucarate dehydratase